MKKPNIEIDGFIYIGDIKAVVKYIYNKEEDDYSGVDLIVVYDKKDGINYIQTEVVWDKNSWKFKNESPSGSYVTNKNKYSRLLG